MDQQTNLMKDWAGLPSMTLPDLEVFIELIKDYQSIKTYVIGSELGSSLITLSKLFDLANINYELVGIEPMQFITNKYMINKLVNIYKSRIKELNLEDKIKTIIAPYTAAYIIDKDSDINIDIVYINRIYPDNITTEKLKLILLHWFNYVSEDGFLIGNKFFSENTLMAEVVSDLFKEVEIYNNTWIVRK